MFSKKVYFATVIVLGLGSVLHIIGRFSPWMFSVQGPNIYNAQKNKVVHGTINFGWFFLEACDGNGCYIQSMSERYNDHSQYANASTVSLFAGKSQAFVEIKLKMGVLSTRIFNFFYLNYFIVI